MQQRIAAQRERNIQKGLLSDAEKALNLHYELMTLNDVLFKETNPGPVKAALGMMGKITPVLRKPMDLPSEALQNEIREVLNQYGILSNEIVTK